MFKDFRCVDYGMDPEAYQMAIEKNSTNINMTSSPNATIDVDNYMGTTQNMNMNMGMGYQAPAAAMPGMVCPPVYECPSERQVHRTVVHEVPQV